MGGRRGYTVWLAIYGACKPETFRAESTQINIQLHQVGKLIHNRFQMFIFASKKCSHMVYGINFYESRMA